MGKGILYLLPVTLGDNDNVVKVIPSFNFDIIKNLRNFVVEDLRSARRFLKSIDRNIDIDKLTFFEFNEHTDKKDVPTIIAHLSQGENFGLLSEAGVPCVADPGAEVVASAQLHNIPVVPLVGPSSIILSLMASGFSGQNFAFLGYLPVENHKRRDKIKLIERRAIVENQTQIFIETPYRNVKMFQSLLEVCDNNIKMCIGLDITLNTEQIITKTIAEWKKNPIPDINKRFAVFLLSGL